MEQKKSVWHMEQRKPVRYMETAEKEKQKQPEQQRCMEHMADVSGKEKDTPTVQKNPLPELSYTFPELIGKLPKISLPPDGIRRQCCRMELSDLEKFPKKWKGLENNHFLLHGYYQYHHLLLVQLSGAKGEQYAVGVPGEFRYRDQYMAETFGFSTFHPLKKGGCGQGAFGYWYLYLS